MPAQDRHRAGSFHEGLTTDLATSEEAYAGIQRSLAFGIINDEAKFLELAAGYDSLLGRKRTNLTTESIINDKSRSWYLYMTAQILRQTRFTVQELLEVVRSMASFQDSKGQTRPSKKRKDVSPFRAETLTSAILGFCRNCDFEPRWHMEKRGDTRPLPTTKGKNLWKHLRNLYTDPEYSRVRTPDAIKAAGAMYKGYLDLVAAAKTDGQARLKEIHGPDADLSPVSDVKRANEVDYDGLGASFVSILRAQAQSEGTLESADAIE